MRKLLPILLTLGVVLFSATEGWSLPPCPSDEEISWTNCFGTYTWDDGDKYVGEWKDNSPHGQGTFTFGKDSEWAGDEYVGEFKDGVSHGQGIYNYSNGDEYVGGWVDDKKHGQGTYTFADGTKYVGEFKDGIYYEPWWKFWD